MARIGRGVVGGPSLIPNNGELQQGGGKYEALINDGGPDDGLLRPKAEGDAELEANKPGFAFALTKRKLECGLTQEEWGRVALREHGGAKGMCRVPGTEAV